MGIESASIVNEDQVYIGAIAILSSLLGPNGRMPKKIRELKAMLRQAGFSQNLERGVTPNGYIHFIQDGLRFLVKMVVMLSLIKKKKLGR